jgi:hypothetical protein
MTDEPKQDETEIEAPAPDDTPVADTDTQAHQASKSERDDDSPETEGHRFQGVSDARLKNDIRPLLG